MKAQLWRLWVSDSTSSATNDTFYPITEVFIPKLNMHINHDYLFISKDEGKERHRKAEKENETYPAPTMLSEIEIPSDMLVSLRSIRQAKIDEGIIKTRMAHLFGDIANGILPKPYFS